MTPGADPPVVSNRGVMRIAAAINQKTVGGVGGEGTRRIARHAGWYPTIWPPIERLNGSIEDPERKLRESHQQQRDQGRPGCHGVEMPALVAAAAKRLSSAPPGAIDTLEVAHGVTS
jgi:hypothetical protein